eukprot:120511_1
MIAPKQCQRNFTECESANRIKSILVRYNQIISDEKSDTSGDLEPNQLLNNVMLGYDAQHRNVQLLNDFYHIKYEHNTNNDPNQFNAFYQFVSDHDSALACDINNCQSVNRHYQRNESVITSQTNTKDACAFNMIDRIHTYCIHSHEISQLTNAEIESIEKELNEPTLYNADLLNDQKIESLSNIMHKKRQQTQNLNLCSNDNKFITKERHTIDYEQISTIFANNNILIDGDLEAVFDRYAYDKQQLTDDVCDIVLIGNDDGILLSDILTNELNCSPQERDAIYHVILYKYINKQELKGPNFIKILQRTALTLLSSADTDQIAQIAQNANVSGNIFTEGTPSFMNRIKFARLFKSMHNWDKNDWAELYTAIEEWDHSTRPLYNYEGMSDDDDNDSICVWNTSDEEEDNNSVCILSDDDDDHKEPLTDDCITMENDDDHGTICSDGIEFWYWEKQRENKRYVNKKFNSLKEEILHVKDMTLKQWQQIVEECTVLLQTDLIKHSAANGKHSEIYGIENGDSITLRHLLSIKLYTDYAFLCNIFCEAFRLRQISHDRYEKIGQVQRRNERIANWAKALIESVQCYGQFITPKTRYYRGIQTQFVLKRFITRFNAPLSTTPSLQKAVALAQRSDTLVLELRRHNQSVSGLNCGFISSFDHEKEVLFFGGDTVFEIGTIFECKMIPFRWLNYRKYIAGIHNISNIADGTIQWNKVNDMKDIIGHLLPGLYVDCQELPPYIISLLNCHLQRVPQRIQFDLSELRHEHEWVHNIFFESKTIPNIANASNLFKHCNFISFVLSNDDDEMNMDCCRSIIKNLSHIINADIAIELKWPSEIESFNLIEARLKRCAHDSESITLHSRINTTTNSILLLPSIVPLPVQVADGSSSRKYDVVVMRFVYSYFEIYEGKNTIPELIIAMICLHIGEGTGYAIDLSPNTGRFEGVKKYKLTSSGVGRSRRHRDGSRSSSRTAARYRRINSQHSGYDDLKNVSEYTTTMPYDNRATSVEFSSLMKVHSKEREGYVEVGAVLTKRYLYFTSSVNYQTWQHFMDRAKIDELVDEDTVIDAEIAAQLVRNLDLVDDKRLMMLMIKQLKRKTMIQINEDILLSQAPIPSLFALFGLPTGRSDVTFDEEVALSYKVHGAINMNRIQSELQGDLGFILLVKHEGCKVYDMPEFKEATATSDLSFELTHDIKCQLETKELFDQWMYQFYKIVKSKNV